MVERNDAASFEGDPPAAADSHVLPDRRELALVAVERTRMPMIITDPRRPDNPIVLANHAFLELTGYSAVEVLGRNCRFLQGPDTADTDVEIIRSGLREQQDNIELELLNYRKDGSTFWNQLSISAVRDPAGALIYYFASQKDVTSRREAQKLEISERNLLKEVDHRAINALALVQSIVSLTRADSIERFSASITGRVDALARAHRLLALSSWSGADLGEIVASEVGASRVESMGPTIRLAPRLVQPHCLVLHELFANSREHGALSRPDASIAVTWDVTSDELILRWTETGVPIEPASAPEEGLGLGLVSGIVERQLNGKFERKWLTDGLEAQLAIPL